MLYLGRLPRLYTYLVGANLHCPLASKKQKYQNSEFPNIYISKYSTGPLREKLNKPNTFSHGGNMNPLPLVGFAPLQRKFDQLWIHPSVNSTKCKFDQSLSCPVAPAPRRWSSLEINRMSAAEMAASKGSQKSNSKSRIELAYRDSIWWRCVAPTSFLMAS